MIDPQLSIDDAPLVFLDVETTGLDPWRHDRICEVAMLRCQTGEVLDALSRLVNPQRPMDPRAEAVNGISDEMLRDAPPFAQVAPQVLDFLRDAILVGHNVAFDLSFLAAELHRARIAMPEVWALDTLILARRHYALPRYALRAVAESLLGHVDTPDDTDTEKTDAVGGTGHRAMTDVVWTRAILEQMVNDLWRRGMRTVQDFFDAQGGPVREPTPSPDRHPPDLPPAIEETWQLIEEAIREHRFLYLHYLSERGDKTERLVQPLSLIGSAGTGILAAHCLLRNAPRYFRLDRILDIDLVERFE